MRYKCLLLLLPILAANTSLAAQKLPAELRLIERQILANVQQMRAATVGVRIGSATASGVIIEHGFVITAAHAVREIGQSATVLLNDGTQRNAKVHGIDFAVDIALLKLNKPDGLSPVTLSPRDLKEPELVIAVGNPFGFDPKRPALVRLGYGVGSDVIQSRCRLARGDSGGPLFDLQGRLIGVHRQILKANDANFHTGAVAIVTSLDRLLAGTKIEGKPQSVTPGNLPRMKLPQSAVAAIAAEILCDGKFVCRGTIVDGPRGLVVTKASEISNGQVSVRYAGSNKRPHEAAVIAVDRQLDLALMKASQPFKTSVQFSPREAAMGQLLISRTAEDKLSILGATSRPIANQRGELGIQIDDGLVITSIQPNSSATAAGLRVGDKLMNLDGTQLATPSNLGTSLRAMNAGDRFRLDVRRVKKLLSLSVQLKHPASQQFDDATFLLGAGGQSSSRRTGFRSVIQHDADIAPSDCGGPVVTFDGRFVGVNIARVGREAVFMISAADVERFVESHSPKE